MHGPFPFRPPPAPAPAANRRPAHPPAGLPHVEAVPHHRLNDDVGGAVPHVELVQGPEVGAGCVLLGPPAGRPAAPHLLPQGLQDLAARCAREKGMTHDCARTGHVEETKPEDFSSEFECTGAAACTHACGHAARLSRGDALWPALLRLPPSTPPAIQPLRMHLDTHPSRRPHASTPPSHPPPARGTPLAPPCARCRHRLRLTSCGCSTWSTCASSAPAPPAPPGCGSRSLRTAAAVQWW